MRNDRRKRNQKGVSSESDKIIMYIGIAIAVLAVVTLALFLYSRATISGDDSGSITYERYGSVTNSTEENNTQSASSSMGKSVDEAANEQNTQNSANVINSNTTSTNTNTATPADTTKTNADAENKEAPKVEKVELNFVKPVDGDVIKEFSNEQLIYSETLKEWTTHLGIDIKAEKASVVVAAEAGTVKSIKNDPRYGLTVVIEHQDGFKTVYSNLLTSEFVVEGENVDKGQTIGTVGNTSAFEVADESHLHFEIWKDSSEVNPSDYIK